MASISHFFQKIFEVRQAARLNHRGRDLELLSILVYGVIDSDGFPA